MTTDRVTVRWRAHPSRVEPDVLVIEQGDRREVWALPLPSEWLQVIDELYGPLTLIEPEVMQ